MTVFCYSKAKIALYKFALAIFAILILGSLHKEYQQLRYQYSQEHC